MLFSLLLAVLALLAVPVANTWRARMRLAMALALFFAGCDSRRTSTTPLTA
jgi:hypothetical protein